ncbi:MAG: UDP-N-acetylmuramoyl-L-alanyl-D-glutamate--2,6-diaminopimelate ligase, partial [Bacteroidales bacterium]|nr:UDP-N-acetylmuramoyl-L-alanyl-D-glutamate--2,6-diaminopimelate ligase [Bacteroidales bacterium]
MKILRDIISNLPVQSVSGNLDIPVDRIVTDSRIARLGDLFIAVRGTKFDGHSFIPEVIRQRVNAVVCESIPENVSGEITWIKVPDTSSAPGLL